MRASVAGLGGVLVLAMILVWWNARGDVVAPPVSDERGAVDGHAQGVTAAPASGANGPTAAGTSTADGTGARTAATPATPARPGDPATPFALAVLVLDHRDTPRAGVPIVVQPAQQVAASDGNGLAHFTWRERGSAPAPWHAAVQLAGLADVTVAFDPDALPQEPLVLRLPPTGTMTVRGRLLGRPWPLSIETRWFEHASLRVLHVGSGAERRATSVADGVARYELLPLRQRWLLRGTIAGGRTETTVDGPVGADEEREVTLAADDVVVLRGVLLDESRQPVRDTWIRFSGRRFVELAAGTLRTIVATDANGRFTANLGRGGASDRIRDAEVAIAREGGPRPDDPAAAIEARDLQPGENDLGTLVLGSAAGTPLVVAGRLVDAEEAMVEVRANARIERFDERLPRWVGVSGLHPTNDVGTFAVFGTVEPARLRLRIEEDDLLPVEPIEFARGTRDLVVRVERGHALAATVLAPESLVRDGVVAVLRADRPLPGQTPGDVDLLTAGGRYHRSNIRRGSNRLQWSGLPAGEYRLEVQLWTTRQVLVAIPHVRVPPVADPRLDAIDLRDRLGVLDVRTVDAAGAPVQVRDAYVVVLPQPEEQVWRGSPLLPGHAAGIPVPPGPLDVLVAAPGYRPATLRGVQGTADAHLAPLPEVELVLQDAPPLPPGCTLHAGFEVRSGRTLDRGHARIDGHAILGGTPGRTLPFENGRVRLPYGEDQSAFRLRLHLHHPTLGQRALDGFTPTEIQPGPTPIAVHVPAGVVLRAAEQQLHELAERAKAPR